MDGWCDEPPPGVAVHVCMCRAARAANTTSRCVCGLRDFYPRMYGQSETETTEPLAPLKYLISNQGVEGEDPQAKPWRHEVTHQFSEIAAKNH